MAEYHYVFDPEKSKKLKKERGVGFEEIIAHIEKDGLMGVVIHPDRDNYPGQYILEVDVKGYIYYSSLNFPSN